MGRERRDIGRRGDAARGDDGDADLACKGGGRRRIDPGQRAVAGDVGVDDRRDLGIGEALSEFDGTDIAGLGPAFDRDAPVARVDADDDAAGKLARRLPHQLRIAQRGGAEHDPVDAESEPVIDRGAVADAAAELDAQIDRLADRRAPRRH